MPNWISVRVNGTPNLPGLSMDASAYVNWGAVAGASGYGLRDNAGSMEFKNSGGAWTAVATASNYWGRTGTTLSPATAGDVIQASAGFAAAPAIHFGDATTGFYRFGPNEVALSFSGAAVWRQSGGALILDQAGTLQWGSAGVTSADVSLSRGAANRLDLESGDSFNIVNGALMVGGAGPHAIGGATDSDRQLYLRGTFSPTTSTGSALLGGSTINAVAGADVYVHAFTPTIVEAASGNHALLTNVHVSAPTVTAGVATVANTASLYVAGPMTATVSGANYAFWIAAGTTVRWGGYGAGTATFDANGNITSVSDARYKEQVREYPAGLAAVRRLKPVLFRWNAASRLDRAHDYAGFVAQDVEQALGPTAVGRDEHGYLTLQDRAILAAAVRAIQELAEQHETSAT